MMRAAARCAAAALAAAAAAHASWLQLGGDPQRDNLRSNVQLPSAATGVTLEARLPAAPSSLGLLPPLVTTQGGAYLTILVDVNCVVTFCGANDATLATWNGCAPADAVVLAPPGLDASGNTLLLVTASGNAYGVDVRAASMGATLWGPIALGVPVVTAPLMLLGVAWLVGTPSQVDATGAVDVGVPNTYQLLRITTTTGAAQYFTPPPCNGTADAFYAPPTLLDAATSRIVTVSSRGCVTAWSADGTVVWTATPIANTTTTTTAAAALPSSHTVLSAGRHDADGTDSDTLVRSRRAADVAPAHPQPATGGDTTGVILAAPAVRVGVSSGPVTLAPIVDPTNARVFLATADGWMCCLNAADGSAPCSYWLAPCVSLGNTAPLTGGLTLSPQTDAFHTGQAFAVDSSGILYAVICENGVVASSGTSLSLGAVSAAAVVIENGLGNTISTAIIVSRDGTVWCVYVGDAAVTDDDDPSDDNGNANDGVAWDFHTAPTPGPTAPVAPPPFPFVTAAGIAVRDDGRLLIPFSDGTLVRVGPTRPPPTPVPESVIIIASVVTVVGLLAALGVTVWCAMRGRRKDGDDGGGDGGGGGSGGVGADDTAPLAANGLGDDGYEPRGASKRGGRMDPLGETPPLHALHVPDARGRYAAAPAAVGSLNGDGGGSGGVRRSRGMDSAVNGSTRSDSPSVVMVGAYVPPPLSALDAPPAAMPAASGYRHAYMRGGDGDSAVVGRDGLGLSSSASSMTAAEVAVATSSSTGTTSLSSPGGTPRGPVMASPRGGGGAAVGGGAASTRVPDSAAVARSLLMRHGGGGAMSPGAMDGGGSLVSGDGESSSIPDSHLDAHVTGPGGGRLVAVALPVREDDDGHEHVE